jgi:hypothetical protein|nr:hypothetical protein [Kofleriaceae bacterium]
MRSYLVGGLVIGASLVTTAGCGSNNPKPPGVDAPAPPGPSPAITATVNSTRFVTREHMLAAGEMQISGEPFAEAMGRDLGNYSRDHIPTDIYFDTSPIAAGPWIDLPGFSTGVESYEYSKQPMNNLAFESGAGTSLAFGPVVNPTGATGSDAIALLAARVQKYGQEANTTGRFIFAAGTFPSGNASGDLNPSGAGSAAENPLGWPGIWPTNHVFTDFDPTIAPTSDVALACAITSDDDPGASGALGCADYECDASTLHLADRASQITSTISPGADGFSAWKYGLWVLNYLQVMHDSTEAGVATVPAGQLAQVGSAGNQIVGDDGTGMGPTAPGTFLGSSDIEGFQAAMFLDMLDNRAVDWVTALTTKDGVALGGFATIAQALQYGYTSALQWFPSKIAVTETADASGFPKPSYALGSPDSELFDQLGLAMGFAEIYSLTDTSNADVGGSQPAVAYFDGDPFPQDDQLANGDATLHDHALAVLRVAFVNIDRMHTDPATGILVDHVAMTGATPTRGTTVSTTTVAYAMLAMRTALRSCSSQLELYSNNTPDTAIGATPLDALALNYPGSPTLTFTGRLEQMLKIHADLLLDHLTDATGRAYAGWDVSANAPIDQTDTLDAHTAAIRGLFAAYLATGDERYQQRAIAVYTRMDATFFDSEARIYGETAAPVTDIEMTPLRFALLQSALRDMYELVASRPGGEALEPVLEERVARVNKLFLNGWDDRDGNRLVDWPAECVNVDAATSLPHGGLQMAERTLTGEIGSLQESLGSGQTRTATSDREQDCVPEIDDAHLPSALADSVTFHVNR